MNGDNWHHQDKEWQITLNLAKEYGWPEPRVASNHGGLILDCPGHDAAHRIRIYSTARGTENAARANRKKIRRCQHSSGAAAILASIEAHLDNADHWIQAAEASLAFHATEERVEAILADAQSLIAEAEVEFDLLTTRLNALDSELKTLVPSEPRPTTEELANYAHSDLRAANEKLRDAPTDSEHLDALRSRHAALKARLHTVRHA